MNLHGPLCAIIIQNRDKAIVPFIEAAKFCNQIGIGNHAGHDLNLDNLNFKQHIPGLLEFPSGTLYTRICLYLGLENTIKLYLRELE